LTTNNEAVRPLTPAMRGMLWVGGFLVFLAGIQLYFLTEYTDTWFSWTIDSALTASFLGAFYWTSVALASLSARQRIWANARVGLPGVQVFVVLMLVATLLHLDKFHFDSSDSMARGAAWLWLAVYALEPPVLFAIYMHQLRVPGADPPRTAPTPNWFIGLIGLQAVVVLVAGVALFVAPEDAGNWWPWALTPLTAHAITAWLIGLGLVLVSSVREKDFARLRPATASYTVLGTLQFVALARYPDEVDWGATQTWIYVAFLVSVLFVGVYGWARSRVVSRSAIGALQQETT
jgi:hypothetical protein